MSNGFAPMYRLIFEKFLKKRTHLAGLYLSLTCEAKFVEGHASTGEWLQKGQALVSLKKLAKEMDVNRNILGKRLKELEEIGLIELTKTNWGFVATLLYYELSPESETKIKEMEQVPAGPPARLRCIKSSIALHPHDYIPGTPCIVNGIPSSLKKVIRTELRMEESPYGDAIETPLIAEIEARQRGVEIVQGLIEEIKREGPPPAEFPLDGEESNPPPQQAEIILSRTQRVPTTKPKIAPPGDVMALAKRWYEFARQNTTEGQFKRLSLLKFAEALNKIVKKGEFNITQLNVILDFLRHDEFWGSVTISPRGLLKPSPSNPDYRKIDRIVRAMKGSRFMRDLQIDANIQMFSDMCESGVEPQLPTLDDINRWAAEQKSM